MRRDHARRRPWQAGWALFTALIAVAFVSAATLIPLQHERMNQQREREAELLWIGTQYRQAIASYYAAGSGGVPKFPDSLEDLLEDNRFPSPRHHLRKLYADPMTGKVDWTLLRNQGAIVGIASSSTHSPLKRTGFAVEYQAFSAATHYTEWRFQHQAVVNGSVELPRALTVDNR